MGRCYICNKYNHEARECFHNPANKIKSKQVINHPAPNLLSSFETNPEPKRPTRSKFVPSHVSQAEHSGIQRCFYCKRLGHIAQDCVELEYDGLEAARLPPTNQNQRSQYEQYHDWDHHESPIRFSPPHQEVEPSLEQLSNHNNTNEHENDFREEEIDNNLLEEALDSLEEHDWNFLQNPEEASNDKYCKAVTLGGIIFKGLIDTCSPQCMISMTAAKKAALSIQLTEGDDKIHSASYTSIDIPTIGKCITNLTVDKVKVANVPLYVVNESALEADVIIGRSWLDTPNVVVLKMRDRLFLDDIHKCPFRKLDKVLNRHDNVRGMRSSTHEREVTLKVSSHNSDNYSASKVIVPKKEEFKQRPAAEQTPEQERQHPEKLTRSVEQFRKSIYGSGLSKNSANTRSRSTSRSKNRSVSRKRSATRDMRKSRSRSLRIRRSPSPRRRSPLRRRSVVRSRSRSRQRGRAVSRSPLRRRSRPLRSRSRSRRRSLSRDKKRSRSRDRIRRSRSLGRSERPSTSEKTNIVTGVRYMSSRNLEKIMYTGDGRR